MPKRRLISDRFIPHFLLLFILLNLPVDHVTAQSDSTAQKDRKIAAIPIVNYDPTLGFNAGAMASIFYKLNPRDTVSPSSSTGIIGIYTTNGTFFGAAFQRLYFDEDNWRALVSLGLGNINFQYWQELPILGGDFIGFTTEATFAMGRIERRIIDKLYGGINLVYARAKTTFDLPDIIPDSLLIDERNLNSIGYLLNYDKRDHQVNPYSGFNIEFANSFYRKWLNSGNDFENYQLTYNHYFQLKDEQHLLVTRIKVDISGGDVPFQGQNVVGQDDIRGYTSGKYRNNQLYAIQAEYRWRFYKRLGMVGFFGVATAVDDLGNLSLGDILPGVGAGLRYMMIPDERINIGVDVAFGKDDWGLYFRIGEAFMR